MVKKNDRKTGMSFLIGTALVLGICLFSAGCLSASPDTDGDATTAVPSLPGTNWQLKSYDNGTDGMVSVTEGSEITLIFDDEGRIAGSAGVNRYFASYEADGDALSFGVAGSTMMAGPEDAMMQETTYLRLLNETASFSGEGNELRLYDSDGTVLLVFEKIPPVTAESLKGSQWVLTSYNNGSEAIVSVISGTEITLEFDDEGRIAGSAGVNRYFASYEADGNALSFGVAGSTMMAGPEDAMMQETTYLKLLNETASFSGVGDELKLYDADGNVLLVFEKIPPVTAESLKGSEWVLTSYNNGNEAIVSVIAGSEITLAFDEEDRIAGSAGVNRYFASYEADGDTLAFGVAGSTMMAGSEDAMMQETTYLKLLNETASFSGVGDELKLYDSDGNVLLVFKEAMPPAPLSLTGTTWVLDSYNNGNEAIVSVIAGTEITLTLDEDGGIAGSAGCNNYFASYEADGNALSFGMIGATAKFCEKPKGTMAQETTYLKLLDTTAGYQIEGDTLTVQDSSEETILAFTAAE